MNDRPKDRGDGSKTALPLYEREAQALREKTERLRALRLARDGAETAATPTRSPAKKTSSASRSSGSKTSSGASTVSSVGKKARKSTETLSDWLKTQEQQGRRS